MRFTEELPRNQYANMVVHTLIPPQKVYDLAEVLASPYASNDQRSSVDGSTYATRRLYVPFLAEECKP
jgi:hypothetical protein